MARTLSVNITLKLDIDTEAWGLEYGFDPKDTTAIREDVGNYIRNATIDHLGGMGLLATIPH